MSGLDQVLSGGRLSHAYLLLGPQGEDRRKAAVTLAAAYLCTGGGKAPCGHCPACRKVFEGVHPDVTTLALEDDKKEIRVEQVRRLRADAYVLPNEAKGKVYIIDPADAMNGSSQNALLKVLEDGPAYAAFLLLAETEGALLPTIRSRCETLRLENLEGAPTDPVLLEEAQKLAAALLGRKELPLLAYCVTLESGKMDRDRFVALLDTTRGVLSAQIGGGKYPDKLLLALIDALIEPKIAQNFHVGMGQSLGKLTAQAAKIWKDNG